MTKFKRLLTLSAVAVMTFSCISASVSASSSANPSSCQHLTTVLRRYGTDNVYYTSHAVDVVVGGVLTHKTCSITNVIYKKGYICASCGSLINTAGTEKVENHSINHK